MAPRTTPTPYNRARKAYSSLQRERLKANCQDYLPSVLESGGKAVKKEAVPASPKDAEAWGFGARKLSETASKRAISRRCSLVFDVF